ncbi:sigma 54-interacting transcriptional regulator, partial [Pseudomonas sp. MD330_10]|uniref:sigma 54-interacting transcriptional regulator n=1 Tax=Pseudomonas sp. MD330_10 TaxID=3241254 RepID=UPI0036D237DC
RIISATHRNLSERVAIDSFREDLYYRLNGVEINLPPLRERSDKAQLLAFLLANVAPGQVVALEEKAHNALLDYAWPGNVRQLRNV